jgi:hypothetical protein
MPDTRLRKTKSLISKATELTFAVPQVVSHRMMRIATTGPTLSERDRKEFELMGAEKTAAFTESWNAMSMQTLLACQDLATSFLQSMYSAPLARRPTACSIGTQFQAAAMDVLDKGMTPIHRKAVANAKRLSRTKLR